MPSARGAKLPVGLLVTVMTASVWISVSVTPLACTDSFFVMSPIVVGAPLLFLGIVDVVFFDDPELPQAATSTAIAEHSAIAFRHQPREALHHEMRERVQRADEAPHTQPDRAAQPAEQAVEPLAQHDDAAGDCVRTRGWDQRAEQPDRDDALGKVV